MIVDAVEQGVLTLFPVAKFPCVYHKPFLYIAAMIPPLVELVPDPTPQLT